jgi:hypothetical protein
VEHNAWGAPEKMGDEGVGCHYGTFNPQSPELNAYGDLQTCILIAGCILRLQNSRHTYITFSAKG